MALFGVSRARMQESGLEKRLANLRPYKPGQNRHTTKRDRIAAKLNELVAEYFPTGGYNVMDGNSLRVWAGPYIDADPCRGPVIRQRPPRGAGKFLSKCFRPRLPP